MSVLRQLSKYTPGSFKRAGLYQRITRNNRIRSLRTEISAAHPLNVLIGSGTTTFNGWITTDRGVLDITSGEDWGNLFQPNSIDRLLAEHVLEHLSEDDCRLALHEAYRHLKVGGLFRIAVPDGHRRDPAYLAEVSPPNAGHQMLYNLETLTELVTSVGFSVTPLEYFDADEQFHSVLWDETDGHIQRSIRFDTQVDFKRDNLFFTSLILDARKT